MYRQFPRQDSFTTRSAKDLQIKLKVLNFKEQIFTNKKTIESRPLSNNHTENVRATWIMSVGSRQRLINSVWDDYCYVKLRISNITPAYTKAFPVQFSFGVINSSNEVELKTDMFQMSSSDLIAIHGNEFEIFTKAKLMSNKTRYMTDDAVTIVCQVSVQESEQVLDQVGLPAHMERIFQESLFTDITIITSDKAPIRAHKNILARSPVFLAMFQNQMLEASASEIHVPNFPYRILRELVYFLYTDRVNDMEQIAGELMVAADFYDVQKLKDACMKSLESHVTFSNFAYSLYVAERFGLTKLRTEVLRFVINNRKTISDSNGWEELKANQELYHIAVAALLNNSF